MRQSVRNEQNKALICVIFDTSEKQNGQKQKGASGGQLLYDGRRGQRGPLARASHFRMRRLAHLELENRVQKTHVNRLDTGSGMKQLV